MKLFDRLLQEEADAIETQRKKDRETLELERSKKMVITFYSCWSCIL